MSIFVTGTDTNVGKTVVSSWLAIHSKYSYWKPIQTGANAQTDSKLVSSISKATVYPESYLLEAPLSPYAASMLEGIKIDLASIIAPTSNKLIVEGAGGVLVPINEEYLMIDLIKQLSFPVIIVASPNLGTINHTLLTIEALKARKIAILGIIMSGDDKLDNAKIIESHCNIKVLQILPNFSILNYESLEAVPFSKNLKQIFN